MGVVEPPSGPHDEDRPAKRTPLWRPFIYGGKVWQWVTHTLLDSSGVVAQPDYREICGFSLSTGALEQSLDIDQSQGDKLAEGGTVSQLGNARTYRVGSLAIPRAQDRAVGIGSVLIGSIAIAQTARHGLMAVQLSAGVPTLLYRREYLDTSGTDTTELHLWPIGEVDGNLLCAFERLKFRLYTATVFVDPVSGNPNYGVYTAHTDGSITIGDTTTIQFRGWQPGHSIQAGLALIDPSTGDIIAEKVLPSESWDTQMTGYTVGSQIFGPGSSEEDLLLDVAPHHIFFEGRADSDPGHYNSSNVFVPNIDRTAAYSGPAPGSGLPPGWNTASGASTWLGVPDPATAGDAFCSSTDNSLYSRDLHGCFYSGPYTRSAVAFYLSSTYLQNVECSTPLRSSLCDACVADGKIVLGPRLDQDQNAGSTSIPRVTGGAVWTTLDGASLDELWETILPDEFSVWASKPVAAGNEIATLVTISGEPSKIVVLDSSTGAILRTVDLTVEDYTETQLVATEDGVYLQHSGLLTRV